MCNFDDMHMRLEGVGKAYMTACVCPTLGHVPVPTFGKE
jgi:hypothetical protein